MQRAAEDHAPDRIGRGGDHAAEGKDQQAADDQRLAADAIGHQAERDLKHRLRQAVDADGDADQRFAGAVERHAVGGQHRQYHKHAEHAQGEDGAQSPGGAALLRGH